MFERFTERAVNVVSEAQRLAKEMGCSEVKPEHLLLALVNEAKGVSLKLFRMYGVTPEAMAKEVDKYIIKTSKNVENIPFSHSFKEILKHTLDLANKSGNNNILFEHLFLSVLNDKNSNIQTILSSFDFNTYNSKDILTKLVEKKIKRLEHPEAVDDDEKKSSFEAVYEGEALSGVLEGAVSKLSAAGYEILGTEQIMASILENASLELIQTINKFGLNAQNFEKHGLANIIYQEDLNTSTLLNKINYTLQNKAKYISAMSKLKFSCGNEKIISLIDKISTNK